MRGLSVSNLSAEDEASSAKCNKETREKIICCHLMMK
jgi:hypothetical protein